MSKIWRNRCSKISFILFFLIAVGQAFAQGNSTRVRVIFPSSLPPAKEIKTHILASCDNRSYQIDVDATFKKVILKSEIFSEVDLSETSLAKSLLDLDTFGRLSFNCPKDAINIFYSGVRLVDGGQPFGLSTAISFSNDGSFDELPVRKERLDELAQPKGLLNRK